MLSWMPDETMLRLQYFIKFKRSLNLKNPKRFTEKLQWYKLNYRNGLMTQCADKYAVREYVKSKGLDHILNELYGVYNSPDEISFRNLPAKYVIKTNNGSGTNIFINDSKKIDFDKLKKDLTNWLYRKDTTGGREWAYKNIEPKIIIEKYLEDNDNIFEGINDWKFMCFNGAVKYVILNVDRYNGHKQNIYDSKGAYLEVDQGYQRIGDCVEKPAGFEEMKRIAENLARDFPFVRVDLYWIANKIYFGELTFYPSSGYQKFEPDDYDFILGEKFVLPQII